MGSSPYGKSVDMVDMCTALMEAGGEGLGKHSSTPTLPRLGGLTCYHQSAAGGGVQTQEADKWTCKFLPRFPDRKSQE